MYYFIGGGGAMQFTGFRTLGVMWDRYNRNELNRMLQELYGKNNGLQTQLNNLVISSGDSNAEVVQARGDNDLLYQRLDGADLVNQFLTNSLVDTRDTLGSHTSSTSNPHKVTKSQLGLDKVVNERQASAKDFTNHVNDTSFKGVMLLLTNNTSVTTNSWSVVSWDRTHYNTANFWDKAKPKRLTIPKGVKKVQLTANTLWESNSDGSRRIRALKNGAYTTGLFYNSTPAGGTSPISATSAIVDVDAGDYFELEVYQSSGSSLELRSDPYTYFSMEVIEFELKDTNINKGHFDVIAHRGASGYEPEHSMASYQLAFDMGSDYIEQDLQLTSDGKLICMHDATVDRTTNGTGAVKDMNLSQIKALTLINGEKIPTYEEVVNHFKDKGIKLYTETKRPHDTKMDDELMRILSKHNLVGIGADRNKVIVQSFSSESLKYIRQSYSELKLVKLTSTPDNEDLDDIKEFAIGIGPRFAATSSAFVSSAQSKGLIVHPYTVNTQSDMERVISWGVDGIFTDYPDRAINLRGDD